MYNYKKDIILENLTTINPQRTKSDIKELKKLLKKFKKEHPGKVTIRDF